MSVAQKTFSATLVVEKFSEQTEWTEVEFEIKDFESNFFGIQPRVQICEDSFVFVYLQNFDDHFKFRAKVIVRNSKDENLFTKEYFGAFDVDNYAIHFSLMLRRRLFSPENGYLDNDKLTLLFVVIEDEQESQEITDSDIIRKDFVNLSENYKSLLSGGKFSDFTLIVGKNERKEFNVHKNILAARSSVFSAMFEYDCEEKRSNKATITDMDEDVCGEMLSFVYSGKVKDLDRFAMELLVAADKYQLHSLKSICEHYAGNHLTVESVANVFILSDLHQATVLKAKCIEYISANVVQVQTTDGWTVLCTKAKLLQELFVYAAMKK